MKQLRVQAGGSSFGQANHRIGLVDYWIRSLVRPRVASSSASEEFGADLAAAAFEICDEDSRLSPDQMISLLGCMDFYGVVSMDLFGHISREGEIMLGRSACDSPEGLNAENIPSLLCSLANLRLHRTVLFDTLSEIAVRMCLKDKLDANQRVNLVWSALVAGRETEGEILTEWLERGSWEGLYEFHRLLQVLAAVPSIEVSYSSVREAKEAMLNRGWQRTREYHLIQRLLHLTGGRTQRQMLNAAGWCHGFFVHGRSWGLNEDRDPLVITEIDCPEIHQRKEIAKSGTISRDGQLLGSVQFRREVLKSRCSKFQVISIKHLPNAIAARI